MKNLIILVLMFAAFMASPHVFVVFKHSMNEVMNALITLLILAPFYLIAKGMFSGAVKTITKLVK